MGQPASTSTATEVLGGLVERVTFHNEGLSRGCRVFCSRSMKPRDAVDLPNRFLQPAPRQQVALLDEVEEGVVCPRLVAEPPLGTGLSPMS
jgi:hypothetical protein